MTAKEYLRRYEEADMMAERYRAEYEKELEMIDSIRSALGGDGMPHAHNIHSEVEDKAVVLSEAARKWKEAEADALKIRQEVFGMICSIGGAEGEILYERYINLLKWEQICVLVSMSWRQTHRLHSKGLKMVEQKISKMA